MRIRVIRSIRVLSFVGGSVLSCVVVALVAYSALDIYNKLCINTISCKKYLRESVKSADRYSQNSRGCCGF